MVKVSSIVNVLFMEFYTEMENVTPKWWSTQSVVIKS